MSQLQASSQEPVRAAGGLLWRKASGGYEIAIVHRNRYNDWSLPKGKLREGESWLQAALREVKEETGFDAEAVGFAGAVSYAIGSGTKVVCFWHMLPKGEPSQHIDQEVAEMIWLPVEAAHEKLDYPLEKALLEIWKAPAEL